MAKDSELWDVICDGPFLPTKNLGESAKEIWEALQTAHEGTTHVKQSKIDMLTTEYEFIKMKDDESIQDMHTRFTSIINELHSIGESILRSKLVRKIFSVLPNSKESKVNSIMEAKDLQTLTMNELVGNLKTYEMKKKKNKKKKKKKKKKMKKDNERREPKREKNLVLNTNNNDSSVHQGLPLLKQDQYNNNFDKVAKRDKVPDKHFKRKNDADNVAKQDLAAWGDSSSESEEENDYDGSSMMVVENETTEYYSIFALMAQSNDDEDDNGDKVNFLDVRRNLKSYSPKKLMSLENVLINAYHSLITDKDTLIMEQGKPEQTRDDLVVIVVDLKETIKNQKKEKNSLEEKIASIEHERDDLMVVVVDLKETFESASREKNPR
ncbi:uncharacterized protein [Nicotiana sylvestris]|uniref:uncharacterized protein n=1 Tax=Nicotiana sylvestris TaxID=4096 RepID=UPI00388CE964